LDTILQASKQVIKKNNLDDYLKKYPWLTGYLGNPQSYVWFIGENPSLRSVNKDFKQYSQRERTENLQWNSNKGDWLLRESLSEAGFKGGDPFSNEGWNCFITNAIKEPEIVKKRNERKKDSNYWQEQALRWLPVLQKQINNGNPKVLVAMGNQARKILIFMKHNGLVAPEVDMIPHYSYIMRRFDRKTKLGPGHPDRIKDYKESIIRIKQLYCT
jgi:hypothetical protein